MLRLMLCLLMLLPSGCAMSEPEDARASSLIFEPQQLDMGEVMEGEKAISFLRIRNTGSTMAQIVAVQASCGCTAVVPESRLLMSGQFTRVRVEIDTFAKMDQVKKWVELTDGEGRKSRAWLLLRVRANPHLDRTSRSLFDGKCRACHYDPAQGKHSGMAIYQAVCAMCHGERGQGAYAPKLAGHHDASVLQALIAQGTGSRHMPGFSRAAGGPLDEKQLRLLVDWILALDD